MAGEDILAALQSPLYSGAETYSGIAAGGVANALPALVDPYGSTGSNALNVFGGTILAALLGNMAKSDAAEQNASIATKQSQFMSASPQERLALTQQDPRTFAKLQAALNTNDLLQQAQGNALKNQLEIQQPFDIEKEKRAYENEIKAKTDPRLMALQSTDDAQKLFDTEDKFTTNFTKHPVVTDYKYKENTLKALTQAYKDKEGTSDFEMLRRVTQMVEPGLAVRQDDQESLQNAASALGVSSAFVDSIVNGNSKNDPKVRAGMMRIAQRAYDSSLDNYNTLRTNAIDRATKGGLDASLVVPYGPAEPFAKLYPDLNISGAATVKPKASDLIAQGYTKGPNGWIPPNRVVSGAPRG